MEVSVPERAIALLFVAAALSACGVSSTTDAGDAGSADVHDVVNADVASDVSSDAHVDARVDAPAVSPAGRPCASAQECGSAAGPWTCETSIAGGECRHLCAGNESQTTEQVACGGAGSTCLTVANDPQILGYCARACNVADGTSACRPGFICTGFWFLHEDHLPDRTGCAANCESDSDCPTGSPCNVRSGVCGAAVDPALRADGEPCDPQNYGAPTATGASFSLECRSGWCVGFTDGSSLFGICGSTFDATRVTSCPDGPDVAPLTQAGDAYGLCLFRSCRTNCDCTAPLLCTQSDFGTNTVCAHLTPGDPGIPCGPPDGGTDAAVDAPAR
jgi:hypothetical protein